MFDAVGVLSGDSAGGIASTRNWIDPKHNWYNTIYRYPTYIWYPMDIPCHQSTSHPPHTLIIVESPAKCKSIESYLPNTRCIASCGHFRELDGLASIDVEKDYRLKFYVCKGKARAIKCMREAIVSAVASNHHIVIATDDDREGEGIAWHICDLFKLPIATTARIVFHEITRSAVQRAYASPGRVNMSTVHAQQARQALDVLIGFRVSPMLWKYVSSSGRNRAKLSAGRCQTPALRVLCDLANGSRGVEKEQSVQYKITGSFTNKAIPFTMRWDTGKEQLLQFLRDTHAHQHLPIPPVTRERTVASPAGLSTVSLQRMAFNELRFTPKQTMAAAQSLYEHGYITYMRTESTTYDEGFVRTSAEWLGRKYSPSYVNGGSSSPHTPHTPQRTQHHEGVVGDPTPAHEAIRPTDISCMKCEKRAGLSQPATRLYTLIWRRTAESLMCDARVESTVFKIQSSDPSHQFSHTVEKVVFPGWKCVGGSVEPPTTPHNQTLMRCFGADKPITWSEIVCEEVVGGATQSHMTETGLIRDLERRGIGRPSTFANIVDTLKDREYVAVKDIEGVVVDVEEWKISNTDQTIVHNTIQRTVGAEKSKLVVSDMGQSVANFLSGNFSDIFAYEFTSQMEKSLDEIVRGTATYAAVCARYDVAIQCAISRVEQTMTQNTGFTLDDRHTVVMGKHGMVVRETDAKGKHVRFHDVRDGVDVGRAMGGEMGLEELVVGEEAHVTPFGTYESHPIEVKKGRYGYYAKWGTNTCNLKRLNVPIGLMCNADVVGEIEKQAVARTQSIVRVVNEQISIRNGKRGSYIMCTGKVAKDIRGGGGGIAHHPKPTFYPLADFFEWFYATESMGVLSGGDIDCVPDHMFVSFVNSRSRVIH